MDYWRIKKRTFTEIIVSSLLGMIISMICVFYLLGKIVTLNKIIDGLENREPIIITQIVKEEENQTETIELKEETQVTEIKKDETLKQNTSSGIKVQGKLEVDDRELLARLLYCEGGGESVECQKAIMSVIVNRLNSGYWGNSFKSVIYAKGQFSPVSSRALNNAKPSQTQYDVVDYVLENGTTIPSWVLYFRASYHFSWKGYTPYCNIDNTYFGGMQ